MKNILVVGSSNADMVIRVPRIPKPGETVLGGEFAVVYGVRGESQGHLIAARSDSLPADLRKLVPAVGAVVPCKGGGGPSLVELVTPEKARLQEAVETAVDWLRMNEEKLKT